MCQPSPCSCPTCCSDGTAFVTQALTAARQAAVFIWYASKKCPQPFAGGCEQLSIQERFPNAGSRRLGSGCCACPWHQCQHRSPLASRACRPGTMAQLDGEPAKPAQDIRIRRLDLTAPTLSGPVGVYQMPMRTAIHTPIATIIRFSVSDTKPSGTLLLPPTQAHFSSRLST